MREHRHRLDASVGASEPHDFAVRGIVTCELPTPRPSHPAPNVRDDRPNAPLIGCKMRGLVKVICPTTQGDFFAGAPEAASSRKLKSHWAWSTSALDSLKRGSAPRKPVDIVVMIASPWKRGRA